MYEMKIISYNCQKCDVEKPIYEFTIYKNKPTRICIECRKSTSKKANQKRTLKYKAQFSAWSKDN